MAAACSRTESPSQGAQPVRINSQWINNRTRQRDATVAAAAAGAAATTTTTTTTTQTTADLGQRECADDEAALCALAVLGQHPAALVAHLLQGLRRGEGRTRDHEGHPPGWVGAWAGAWAGVWVAQGRAGMQAAQPTRLQGVPISRDQCDGLFGRKLPIYPGLLGGGPLRLLLLLLLHIPAGSRPVTHRSRQHACAGKRGRSDVLMLATEAGRRAGRHGLGVTNRPSHSTNVSKLVRPPTCGYGCCWRCRSQASLSTAWRCTGPRMQEAGVERVARAQEAGVERGGGGRGESKRSDVAS